MYTYFVRNINKLMSVIKLMQYINKVTGTGKETMYNR